MRHRSTALLQVARLARGRARFGGYPVLVYDYNLLTRVTVPAGPRKGFRPG